MDAHARLNSRYGITMYAISTIFTFGIVDCLNWYQTSKKRNIEIIPTTITITAPISSKSLYLLGPVFCSPWPGITMPP